MSNDKDIPTPYDHPKGLLDLLYFPILRSVFLEGASRADETTKQIMMYGLDEKSLEKYIGFYYHSRKEITRLAKMIDWDFDRDV